MKCNIAEFKFNNKHGEYFGKTAKNSKHLIYTLVSLTLIALLVSAPIIAFSVPAVNASEPTLSDIFNYLGYTNVSQVDVSTFPAGVYQVTLLAEFAGYHDENVLSYYHVETTDYITIFSGPEGATGGMGGYVVPPLSKTIIVSSEFALSMMAPEYRYFTENWKNPDYPQIHAVVYANLDSPGMYLIGFENYYGDHNRDYNDMVFSLVLYSPPEIVSVTRSPQTPNYDQSVTVTAQVTKGDFDITSVILSYQIDSGSWTNVAMSLDAGDYVADIPALPYGTTVNYKVYASDTIGNNVVSALYSYTVGDFVSPVISNIAQSPSSPNPAQSVTITANVTEPAEASGVKNVTLWYAINSVWTPVPMTLQVGLWVAHIPGQTAGQLVNYYIEAFDNAENSASTSAYGYSVLVPNTSPIAEFTILPSIIYTGDTVEFDASGSYDPDGYINSYAWNFGDGTTATGVNPTHSYAQNGGYSVTLSVTDNVGATSTKTMGITVNNRAPVADITSTPSAPSKEQTVTFDASSSYDPDGTIVSYSWKFGDGTTATGVTATHSYSFTGSYTVTLTVTDDDGAKDSTTITKTVSNQAPVAIFTESAESAYVEGQITFDAADSYDPDGTIVSYVWTFGDGTTATGVTAQHAYGDNGEYTVTLTVTDDEGATDSETVSITVMNTPPVALFTSAPETGSTNTEFSYDASESYDVDGTIVSYVWDFGDGTTATGVSVTHTFLEDGTYTVTLTVTDDDGATATATETKTVPNQPPVAAFTETAEIVSTGDIIQFDGSISYDVDGTIVSYVWDFGDGTTATGVTAEHVYSDNGAYTVTLTVTDDDGATDSETATKTILNRQPVAEFTASTLSPAENEAIQFDASASYDVDGTIVSYEWNFGDGTTATGVTVEHTYSEAGEYTVTLIVTDNDGDSASADAATVTMQVDTTFQLAILSVVGLGIATLTLTILYGLFIRRRRKRQQNED